MRSFSPAAQAAMNSGVFTPYFRIGLCDTYPDNVAEWIEPIYFKLTDVEAEVTIPVLGTSYADGGFFCLRRGVVIDGIPETTTTSSFFLTSWTRDEKFYYLKGCLLPSDYKNLGVNLTWKQIIDTIYLDELNPTTKIIKPSYEYPAHPVWNYKFYPTGRNVIFNSLYSIFSIFKQKYLIFMRHTENTFTVEKIDIYFYQPTETRAVDYSLTDIRFDLIKGQFNFRRLLWRDDAMTTHIYTDPAKIPGSVMPRLHNLGYIQTGGDHPTYENHYYDGKSSKLSPNLKYESGDYVTIISSSSSVSTRIKVTEVFNPKETPTLGARSSPAWHMIIEPIQWFTNVEGGILPSTIEAAAPYTPLNTSTFNYNLNSTVNNLQALAEAVDELVLGGWTSSTGTWTYVSANAPTFIASALGDMTTILSPGMRIKLTQTTTKYFIIVAIGAFSAGNTPVTLYGGTDYTLTNAAITNPFYSSAKAPFGFPLNPSKWTVTVTDTTDRFQASPTSGTIYNLGSVSISVPIGTWNMSFDVSIYAYINVAGAKDMVVGLSTANNTFSDASWTMRFVDANTTIYLPQMPLYRQRIMTFASKTTYYFNSKTNYAGLGAIYNLNNQQTLTIKAVCAYL